MRHYSTLDYLSNEVLFADFYKHCLEKLEKKKFCGVTYFAILNNMRINKQPNDCNVFRHA